VNSACQKKANLNIDWHLFLVRQCLFHQPAPLLSVEDSQPLHGYALPRRLARFRAIVSRQSRTCLASALSNATSRLMKSLTLRELTSEFL